jgi:uncharacterized protein (UPF0548 family)
VNATREQIAHGGFVHDFYQAPFTGDFERAVDALLAYRIFAPHRMIAHVCTRDHRVAVGATIVQRVLMGPLAIETAVRVIEMDRTANRVSFAYATLSGHPERGVASFAVVRGSEGSSFEAHAWSRAGHWLTILGRPISRALQRSMTREAVASFCGLAALETGSPSH